MSLLKRIAAAVRKAQSEEADFPIKPNIATIKSSFDGDTMSYELLIDGKSQGWHWSTNSARERAKELGARFEGDPPELSHMPHPDDVAEHYPDHTGPTSTVSNRVGDL